MASRWKIQYSVNVTPIEEVELSGYDATTAPNEVSRTVHTGIDRTVGGSLERLTSTDSSGNIKAVFNKIITSTYQSIESSGLLNANMGATCTLLYIKIAKPFSTDVTEPDLLISFDAGSSVAQHIKYTDDQVLLRFETPVDPTNIHVKCTAAANLCYVDMLIGLN